jgi:hypothetical protein
VTPPILATFDLEVEGVRGVEGRGERDGSSVVVVVGESVRSNLENSLRTQRESGAGLSVGVGASLILFGISRTLSPLQPEAEGPAGSLHFFLVVTKQDINY